jgi:hypothetical protein
MARQKKIGTEAPQGYTVVLLLETHTPYDTTSPYHKCNKRGSFHVATCTSKLRPYPNIEMKIEIHGCIDSRQEASRLTRASNVSATPFALENVETEKQSMHHHHHSLSYVCHVKDVVSSASNQIPTRLKLHETRIISFVRPTRVSEE